MSFGKYVGAIESPTRNRIPERLDGVPPSPPARRATPPPSDTPDTDALYGTPEPGTESGSGQMGAYGRALAGVAMLIQGTKLISAVLPGAITPELAQMIDILRETVPRAVTDMNTSGGAALLGAAGAFPMAASPLAGLGFGGAAGGPMGAPGMIAGPTAGMLGGGIQGAGAPPPQLPQFPNPNAMQRPGVGA